jgi:outer membrane protein OmpA-like peptidoglycan-associated protein
MSVLLYVEVSLTNKKSKAMKILVIGFLAFSSWSALSTYIYVCRIKGLCNLPITMQMDTVKHNDVIADDTLSKPVIREQLVIPKNLKINFAFDKSEFKADAETDKYFNESNAYLDQNIQARLSIIGYTDAIGSSEYNQALGYRRAQSMQHYFETKGMLSNKIILESKGEREPADDNSTKEGRANNRRATITIIK